VEVSRQQAQKKIWWDFVHALLEFAAWRQAGEDRAIAAGSKADLKSGCRPLVLGFLFLAKALRFWLLVLE
jgi:hypothetical protein